MLITADDGGIVNDPVLLRVEENRWWLALADSDAGLYARGVAVNSGLDVTVREPEVYPIQVQGPRSKDVLQQLVGDAILDVKYYWTLTTEIAGIPVIIKRTAGRARSGTRSTCAIRRVAATSGTASSRRASPSTSARSRRSRHGASRPGSSTTART